MTAKNWKNISEVTVSSAYKKVVGVYPSLASAVRHGVPTVYSYGEYIPDYHGINDFPLGHYWKIGAYEHWSGGARIAFYDELGLRIPAWKVIEAWENLPNTRRKYPSWYHRSGRHYRNSRAHGPKLSRIVRQHALIESENEEALAEYEVKIKSGLHVDDYPHPYDWNPTRSIKRSWKGRRKTQYKTVDKWDDA